MEEKIACHALKSCLIVVCTATLFLYEPSVIFHVMKFPRQHIFALLALAGYLLGSALLEITHHDATELLSHSQPVWETHACGANEIHVAWEDARHCIACSYFSQRISTEVNSFSLARVSLFTLASIVTHAQQTLDADVLHSGKRGPPIA
jgi:hypothetical protein